MPDMIEITVEGRPGEDFQIWYRGAQDAEGTIDEVAPIVHTGKIGPDGRSRVGVPSPAYLLLGRPTRSGGVPLELNRTPPVFRLHPAT